MKTLRTIALGCLLVGVLGSGCAKKINDKSATLLTTVRVSLGASGTEGNAEVINPMPLNSALDVERPAVSDDGRYVVFTSKASNLVATDTNGASDVFRRDNVLRTTALVSKAFNTNDSANGPSSQPTISGDGNLVVFQSIATNLTSDNLTGTGPSHIFIRNMTTGTTSVISRASGAGSFGDDNSNNAQISASGRYVVWDTQATNFDVINDNNSDRDVYRRDLGSAGLETILISRRSGIAGVKGNGDSTRPTVSSDGRFVCFQTAATNLPSTTLEGAPDTSSQLDIYVRDTATGATTRVSVSKAGDPAEPNPNGICENAMISADGTTVVYRSLASNLVQEDDGTTADIFVRNLNAGTTEILSVHSSGAQAGNGCNFPRISADGQIIVWDSPSPNLVNGDANNQIDVFMRNRTTSLTTRISVSTFGGELNGESRRPNLSGDGKFVVFNTLASNAADDDTNGTGDIYMRGPPF